MKTIEITQEEIKMATRPNVYRNKKKYTRKDKHKNKQTWQEQSLDLFYWHPDEIDEEEWEESEELE